MDRREAMIHQHLYWPSIRYAIRKEVTNFYTFQCTKWPNKKYGKLTAKEAEEIPRNKLCVDIIGPYMIRRNRKKENLNLKAVSMIYPVTGWFEIIQYEVKRAKSIAKLV